MMGNNTEMTKQSLESETVLKTGLGKVFNKVEKCPLQTAQRTAVGGGRMKTAHTVQGAQLCKPAGAWGPDQERPPVRVRRWLRVRIRHGFCVFLHPSCALHLQSFPQYAFIMFMIKNEKGLFKYHREACY